MPAKASVCMWQDSLRQKQVSIRKCRMPDLRKNRTSRCCVQEWSYDNDNDDDRSSSQLSAHKDLTCREGKGAWALASSLFGQELASRNKLFT